MLVLLTFFYPYLVSQSTIFPYISEGSLWRIKNVYPYFDGPLDNFIAEGDEGRRFAKSDLIINTWRVYVKGRKTFSRRNINLFFILYWLITIIFSQFFFKYDNISLRSLKLAYVHPKANCKMYGYAESKWIIVTLSTHASHDTHNLLSVDSGYILNINKAKFYSPLINK